MHSQEPDTIKTDTAASRSVIKEVLKPDALIDRLNPQPGCKLYLHLSDLRMALDSVATDKPLRILDYGCGGSPYQALFPNAEYHRADLPGNDGVDYLISPGTPLAAPDAGFDMILSTQVAEHVEDPADYFSDCCRLLRSGGCLVVATHGSFPDHGTPWDFQRWTSFGLKRALTKAGFETTKMLQVTTGPRAVLQFWEMCMERLPGPPPFGTLFRILTYWVRRQRSRFHAWADRAFPAHRVVLAEDFSEHRFYVELVAVAIRNESGKP